MCALLIIQASFTNFIIMAIERFSLPQLLHRHNHTINSWQPEFPPKCHHSSRLLNVIDLNTHTLVHVLFVTTFIYLLTYLYKYT